MADAFRQKLQNLRKFSPNNKSVVYVAEVTHYIKNTVISQIDYLCISRKVLIIGKSTSTCIKLTTKTYLICQKIQESLTSDYGRWCLFHSGYDFQTSMAIINTSVSYLTIYRPTWVSAGPKMFIKFQEPLTQNLGFW